MRRRVFESIIAPVVLALVLVFGAVAPAWASAPQARTQAPGFYRMMLGDFEITALLDGTHPVADDAVLTKAKPGGGAERAKLFDDDPREANALLAAADVKVPTEGSVNGFLINTGTKLILIDSGAGTFLGACCGHLIENLKASGYQPEQVDEILLTHLHPDHLGGIAPGGRIAFPNAVVRASKRDADYWLSDANEKAASALFKPMFESDKASLAPYIAAGRFQTFDGDPELVPGIQAVPAPGHTPGHTAYSVESGGRKLLVWGDIVHVAAIQFPDPSVTVEYDTDETLAEATRKAILAKAAAEGFWVAGAHIAFPGLGHVGLNGKTFIWMPGDYSARLSESR